MKKLIILAILAISFMSCEKEAINITQEETIDAKILGEWELYRDESLESIIDQWTGSEWTYIDQWFHNTREDSGIILEFKADGTFNSRYADVVIESGVWEKLSDNSYTFNFTIDNTNNNETLTQIRYITVYCDNTYTVEVEGNTRRIDYYRNIGTVECSDLMTYNVE